MFDRYNKAVEEIEDLNLIPVMNLFMVLIPFLLLAAAFYHVGAVPTSLPTHTPTESDVPKTPTTVTTNLVINPDGMDLTCSSTSLTEEELAAISGSFPKKDGDYDIEGLQAYLKELKAKYPESNTMIVLPHEDLAYQELVSVLDKTREYDTGKKNREGEPVFADLFPVVVFSRFIPPSEAAPGEGGAPRGEEKAQ